MSNIDYLNRFKFHSAGIDISRSVFKLPHECKTSFISGKLIPIGLFEVLPGDSFRCNLSSVVRMLTPVFPTMDNSFLDVYAFFVPNRIACLHPGDWEKICGENTNGYWAPSEEHTLENTGNMFALKNISPVKAQSVFNYYGLPIMSDSIHGSAGQVLISNLPFVGYTKIWNEWFRDQNVQAPLNPVLYHQSNSTGFSSTNGCYDVNKLHDYFTSALPSPQKGNAVLLPLGEIAPVILEEGSSTLNIGSVITGNVATAGTTGDVFVGGNTNTGKVVPKNLVADLSNATAATVNQLRQAFAIQRLLEKDARGGSRFREILKTHYNTIIPDSTIQIPQYLGGKRVPLNITQVLQTSSTDETSPLGQTGAFSNTAFNDFLFDKSFTEHGYIHVVCCVRTAQSYSQGIAKHFTRNRRYDWYYPAFANLGEQAILKRELKCNSSGDDGTAVFGYCEAWSEYRYLPNRITGFLAPDSGDVSLVPWTYTNKFSSQPTLNSSFMVQSKSNVGDTLAYADSDYQFIGDFYFDIVATRPLPVYSIPGLIDHH